MTRFHPPGLNSSRVGQRLQVAIGAAAALAAISLSPGSAHAYVVTVGGVQYDVTTFTGTYNDNISKFALPTNGGVMPWWDSFSIASQFAAAVGSSLGYPNSLGPDTFGPIFARGYDGNVIGRYYGYCNPVCSTSVNDYYRSASESRVWAQVAPASVPGPLPLFGAAAAFGFSRQLRKRIKLAQGALGSSQPRA